MIYCCSNCRYVFEEDAEPGYCPDCGKDYIRYATGKIDQACCHGAGRIGKR